MSRPAPADLSEDLLAFCEQSRTVFWVYDLEIQAITYVNRTFEELWGRSAEELYADPTVWFEGVHEDDRARVRAAVRGLREGHYEVEYRVQRPDGRVSWVHARAVSFRPDRVMGIAQDRTERRALEATLRAMSEELPDRFEEGVQALLRLVVEETGAHLAFLGTLEPDGPLRVRTVQARDREGPTAPFEYPLLGSPCEQVFENRLCYYPREVAERFPEDAALREVGAEGYLGVPLRDLDGVVHGILVALFDTPIEDGTGARALFRACGERMGTALARTRARASLARAVRERTRELAEANHRLLQSEERYRVFVERSPVGIWCIEMPAPIPLSLPPEEQQRRIAAEAHVVECNDVVALRLGLRSGKELEGLPVTRVPTFWSEETRAALHAVIQRGYELTDAPRTVELPDGTQRHLRTDLVPILEDGGLVRLWCTERDVTDQVLDAENMAQRTSRLIHFSRLNTLGEMAAGIAHELNQPLAAIVNYARGCVRRLSDEEPPEVREAMGAIVDQAERAAASLRRLRGLSRVDSGRREPCSLSELLRASFQLVDVRRREAGAELELVHDAADDTVLVEPLQIEQVVLQILRNAFEALEDSGAEDRGVSVHVTEHGPWVEVSVRDAGPGLDPVAAANAFDPFFSTRAEGAGLGLTVSRTVVEAHGGRLWHVPVEGGGAAFHFTLPRRSETMTP